MTHHFKRTRDSWKDVAKEIEVRLYSPLLLFFIQKAIPRLIVSFSIKTVNEQVLRNKQQSITHDVVDEATNEQEGDLFS
jgi:hypothetical protein